MRRWPQDARQTLRFLAAARFFLPAHLHTPPEWEENYRDCLHHADFGPALDWLERLGDAHAGHIDELRFWKELYFAAQHMTLTERALRYEARVQQVVSGSQI
jgi:hypothetical protein